MRKFEYQTVTDRHSDLNNRLAHILNDHGSEGWELVSVDQVDMVIGDKIDKGFSRFIYKREIMGDAKFI